MAVVGLYEYWRNPDIDDLCALLTRPADGWLDVRPVPTAVNHVRNNGAHLLDAAT
ncbi:hypothetical protein ACFQ9H_28150 [Streptomyces sp. NPDC056517]|uniref:hypothetical protein n=1 Tax=unclassified Streptomyces TaxID=2593676 RepID=UPI0036870AD0